MTLAYRKPVVTILATLLITAGCSTSTTTSTTNPNGSLVVNSAVAPATLDINVGGAGANDQWAGNFYRQLLRLGRKPGSYPNTTVMDSSQILGDLALSWTVSAD